MNDLPPCFKANDIRGLCPQEIDEGLVQKIARAFAEDLPEGGLVVVGQDARLESPSFAKAAIEGLKESGLEVLDLGLCGTEEVYFHTSFRQAAGGLMITASHNPKGYNGVKLVRSHSKPVGIESGLREIGLKAMDGRFRTPRLRGQTARDDDKSTYIDKLLSFIDIDRLRPLVILADPGNGAAGPILRAIEKRLPFAFHFIREEADGNFPTGAPDPLKKANQEITAEAVKNVSADLGIAWDGDCDRCFLFDAEGRFVDGYYLVGMLAETLAAKEPGARIIHDHRLVWNTIEKVKAVGGEAVRAKTGHVFMKERMREVGAIYGGEMSSHHFFRDFFYCDSGMLPWLLVTELMSKKNASLGELVSEAMSAYPCSGDLSYKVPDPKASVERIRRAFEGKAGARIETEDGLSVEFSDWRFNARSSNTEALLRLTIETRGDRELVAAKVKDIEKLIFNQD